MTAKTFDLDIVTPTKNVFSGEVTSFIGPGTEGYFQIMAGHTPFLVTMEIGELKIKTEDEELLFATSGGFAEIGDNKVSILAETAEKAGEIDIARAEESKKRAEEVLNKKDDEADLDRARLSLFRAINRLKIHSG